MGSSSPDLNDDSATVSDSDSSATKTDSESDTETDEECQTRSPIFQIGDKVLALHGKLWYEAKVRRIEFRENKCQYFVHYWGWKEKWDEWLGVDRIMKYNVEILQKQDEALSIEQEEERNPDAGHASQTKSDYSVVRSKKQKMNSVNEEKEAITSEKLMNLHIPPTLKKQLIDDCEFVTHLGKLVKLPRAPNVNDILEKKYLDYRLMKDGRISAVVQEFVKCLEHYFNQSLPLTLLYKSEHQQFADSIRDNVDPSTVYGAEHLLRLFVKLPNMLARSELEEETLTVFQKEAVHFLKFLRKNQSELFLSTYHVLEESETSTNKQDV